MLDWFHRHLSKDKSTLSLPKRINDRAFVDKLLHIHTTISATQLKHLNGRYRSMKGFPSYYATIDECLREHYNLQVLLDDPNSLEVERHRMGRIVREFRTLDYYLDEYTTSQYTDISKKIVTCLKDYKERKASCELLDSDRFFVCMHYDLYHFTALLLGETNVDAH